MKLLTKAIVGQFEKLGRQDKEASEVKVPLKLFQPWGSFTWYATEYDPQTRTCFGFVTSSLCPEGDELSGTKFIPTSTTIAPSLIISAFRNSAFPMAITTISAIRV